MLHPQTALGPLLNGLENKKKSSSKIPREFRASTPHDARIPAIRGPFAQSLSRHALTHSRATHAHWQTQSEGDQGREGRGGEEEEEEAAAAAAAGQQAWSLITQTRWMKRWDPCRNDFLFSQMLKNSEHRLRNLFSQILKNLLFAGIRGKKIFASGYEYNPWQCKYIFFS